MKNSMKIFLVILASLSLSIFSACGGGSDDNPTPASTGTITGTVTDADTSALLSGVTVSSGGVSDTTGADGVYTLTSVAVGNQSITATLTGYQTYTGNVTVTQDVTVTEDISLVASVPVQTTAQLMEGTWWDTQFDDGLRQDGTNDDHSEELDGLATMKIGDDGSWSIVNTDGTFIIPQSRITIDEASNTVTLMDEDGQGRSILVYDATSNSINTQWQRLADDGVTFWENYETSIMTVPTGNEGTSLLLGSWLYNPGALADSGVITFIDATNYMFAVDGEPDDGGGRGMERGTYTWDFTSGAFTATAISATLGDWGISDLNTMTVSIDGDTLELNDSVEGLISFTKVSSNTNPIIGGWLGNPDALADSGVITFIDDTNYFYAVDGEPDDGGGRGMERGTYTWDSASGAFTATAISTSATLGDWGISDLNTMTISIVGDTLELNDSVEGIMPLTKVQ